MFFLYMPAFTMLLTVDDVIYQEPRSFYVSLIIFQGCLSCFFFPRHCKIRLIFVHFFFNLPIKYLDNNF